MKFDPKDCRIEYYSTGSQKDKCAVTVIHLPTSRKIIICGEQSTRLNEQAAMKLIRKLIEEME